MALGAKVYENIQKEQANNQENANPSDNTNTSSDGVSDAEYEEK